MSSTGETDADTERALALLEATHKFPTEYNVSVIAVTDDGVLAGILAAVEFGLSDRLPADAHEKVPSRAGKYTSHRFRVPCAAPKDVLALYARLRGVTGVMTIL